MRTLAIAGGSPVRTEPLVGNRVHVGYEELEQIIHYIKMLNQTFQHQIMPVNILSLRLEIVMGQNQSVFEMMGLSVLIIKFYFILL